MHRARMGMVGGASAGARRLIYQRIPKLVRTTIAPISIRAASSFNGYGSEGPTTLAVISIEPQDVVMSMV